MDGLSDFPMKASKRVFPLPIRVNKLFRKKINSCSIDSESCSIHILISVLFLVLNLSLYCYHFETRNLNTYQQIKTSKIKFKVS